MNPNETEPSPLELQRRDGQRSQMQPTLSKDPVCGMEVPSGKNAALIGSYDGETFEFCSDECRDKFQANPGRYVVAH